MRDQSLKFLEKLINTPSPVGYENRGQRVWLDYVAPFADATETDAYGNAVTEYEAVVKAQKETIEREEHVQVKTAEDIEGRALHTLDEETQRKAEAEAANLSKTRFIAAASHDILQPLNAARLYATSLVERQRDGLGAVRPAPAGATGRRRQPAATAVGQAGRPGRRPGPLVRQWRRP